MCWDSEAVQCCEKSVRVYFVERLRPIEEDGV